MINNKIAVCMLLDKKTKGIIEPLQMKLGRKFPSAHVSIAIYENIEPDVIVEYTREFCRTHKKAKLTYTGIGIMPDTEPFLYYIPRVTPELMNMYVDFHQKHNDKCIPFTSLDPYTWTPHTSLCKYSDEAMEICIKHLKHMEGSVVGMKVVDATGGKYRILGRFEL